VFVGGGGAGTGTCTSGSTPLDKYIDKHILLYNNKLPTTVVELVYTKVYMREGFFVLRGGNS
jgi:hypothetical protein